MMTGIERTLGMLRRTPIDRIPVYEHFWRDTRRTWAQHGDIPPDCDLIDLFRFDMEEWGAYSTMANPGFAPVVVEERENTVLLRDGNGALLRRHKTAETTPEHVDFLVKDRSAWLEHVKPLLVPDARRINFESYRARKEHCRRQGRFFFLSGAQVFEMMVPVCGHEYMLMGMLDDPEWIADMVTTYNELILGLQEILFEREGLPDGIWYFEDMGYKGSPFFSPAMYREFLLLAHKRAIDFAHARRLPVVMHSCGMVESLLPHMVEAGMDCLQALEVKAGMDLLKIYRAYGDRLSLMGGLDVRALYTNDLAAVDRELALKIPQVIQGYGFALHSDHSIPPEVHFSTYQHFMQQGLLLGRY